MTEEIPDGHFEKSYELVGHYLSKWANMEGDMDKAIGVALNLTNLQTVIVCANIGFTSKCHILKTLVNLVYVKDGKDYEKTIEKVKKLSVDRNMIAHTVFFPTPDKNIAVRFYVQKAKGKLNLPLITWKESAFEKKAEELREIGKKFKKLATQLSGRDIADALMKKPGSKLGLLGQGYSGLLSHQLQGDQS